MGQKKFLLPILGALGGMLIVVVIGWEITLRTLRLQPVPLANLTINSPRVLGLFMVEDRTQLPARLRIFRVSDGKEQTVTGTFSYLFTTPDEAIVYGSPDKDLKKQTLFIINPFKAHFVDLARLPGRLVVVDPSPNFRFLALRGLTATGTAFTCMLPKNSLTTKDCFFLNEAVRKQSGFASNSLVEAFWNTNRQAEYVIPLIRSSSSERYAVFHPTNREILVTTTPLNVAPIAPIIPFSVKSWGALHRFVSREGKAYYAAFDTDWQLLQFANGYILGLDAKQAYLIDPATRRYAIIAPLPPEAQRVILIP